MLLWHVEFKNCYITDVCYAPTLFLECLVTWIKKFPLLLIIEKYFLLVKDFCLPLSFLAHYISVILCFFCLSQTAFRDSALFVLKLDFQCRIDGDTLKSYTLHWPPQRWQEYEPILSYCRENGIRVVACGTPLKVRQFFFFSKLMIIFQIFILSLKIMVVAN